MERNSGSVTNNCNFAGVRPAMMDLPYPPIQVREKNHDYACLLSFDYCGAVSEMSAITQYINNENRMSGEKCSLAKTILGIAMAEMIHLQKLGELMYLLGGCIDFCARQPGGGRQMWTPAFLSIPDNIRQMLYADIQSEKEAIEQYRMHVQRIKDDCVNAVLLRIVKDEEYHIMMLQSMLEEM